MRGHEVIIPIDPPFTDRESLLLERIERLEEETSSLRSLINFAGVTERIASAT